MAVKIFLLTVSIIVAFGLGEGGRQHKCIHDQIAVIQPGYKMYENLENLLLNKGVGDGATSEARALPLLYK